MNPHQEHGAVDWPVAIGYLVLVRQRQGELIGGWRADFTPPRDGASEAGIAAVEARWGPLEATYRAFLGHVNGWQGAAVDFSFLDTAALLDARSDAALVEYLTDCEVEPDVLAASEVVPLTVANEQGDMLMAGRTGTAMAGQVIWWAPSGEVARYPLFAAAFAALSELEERVLERAGHPRVAARARYDDLRGLDEGTAAQQVHVARTITADPAASWPMETMVTCLAGLKAALARRGLEAVWGHQGAPGGASVQDVEAVALLYGVALERRHARLLGVVDGWEHVMLSFDLLSTAQLRDAARMRPALLHARTVLDACGHDFDGYLVIASSTESADTLVVSPTGGQVLWLRGADQIMATYPDVDHWLLSIIDAHLGELDTAPEIPYSPLT